MMQEVAESEDRRQAVVQQEQSVEMETEKLRRAAEDIETQRTSIEAAEEKTTARSRELEHRIQESRFGV